MVTCEYVISRGTGNAMHCEILRNRTGKWDLCIHQYFCRADGKQKLNADAEQCKIRLKGRD